MREEAEFDCRRCLHSFSNKLAIVEPLVLHEKVLNILDHVLAPNYLLSASQAIEILPGEHKQPWHNVRDEKHSSADQLAYRIGRTTTTRGPLAPGNSSSSTAFGNSFLPHPNLSNTYPRSIDPFTIENGGTHIIPGSHLWGEDQYPNENDPNQGIRVQCPAGSVCLFVSTAWHAGGANRTDKPRMAVACVYGEPWVVGGAFVSPG